MLSYNIGEENEMFFDSLDRLPATEEETTSSSCGKSDSQYEIWANEPLSVEERRERFLKQMGFLAEFRFSETKNSSAMEMGLNPIGDSCSGTEHSFVEEEEEAFSIMSNEESNFLQIESPLREEEEERKNVQDGTKKAIIRSWWKRILRARKEKRNHPVLGSVSSQKVKVCRNSKRFFELTAACVRQEIRAHEGIVWAMKFSPNGQYLASGGKDGVVRVWRVMTVDASSSDHHLTNEGNLCTKLKEGKFGFRRKNPIHASVVFPDKIFRIDESPIQEFYGHSSDVLDLAWSNSNNIISSSMDKTVRLWELGRDESIDIFCHNDYVTCIEFNPVDDNYFISGSIDGKVRIWGLSEKRVVDWTDVRDVITAICYQPDGKGFIVGTITGTCRSYKTLGECMLLVTKINISGRKKTAGNKITGIKFSHDKPQRVMISSEDSKLRIFEGIDLFQTYKGLAKSGSQTSASFTSNDTHIVSVGDDSRVYIWNYDVPSFGFSSKQTKSVRSCEHFVSHGVSVAVPWPKTTSLQSQLHGRVESTSWSTDSERFTLGSWFSIDGPCGKATATWPEEKLPLLDLVEDGQSQNHSALSSTWGLVIVTGGLDGAIRTFHNYGLPVRL